MTTSGRGWQKLPDTVSIVSNAGMKADKVRKTVSREKTGREVECFTSQVKCD